MHGTENRVSNVPKKTLMLQIKNEENYKRYT